MFSGVLYTAILDPTASRFDICLRCICRCPRQFVGVIVDGFEAAQYFATMGDDLQRLRGRRLRCNEPSAIRPWPRGAEMRTTAHHCGEEFHRVEPGTIIRRTWRMGGLN